MTSHTIFHKSIQKNNIRSYVHLKVQSQEVRQIMWHFNKKNTVKLYKHLFLKLKVHLKSFNNRTAKTHPKWSHHPYAWSYQNPQEWESLQQAMEQVPNKVHALYRTEDCTTRSSNSEKKKLLSKDYSINNMNKCKRVITKIKKPDSWTSITCSIQATS